MSDTGRRPCDQRALLGRRIEDLQARVEELTRQRDREAGVARQRLKLIRRLTEEALDLKGRLALEPAAP